MLEKIINFIKYHNAFIIIIAFIFVASFSALAADEDLRDKVLGEKVVTENGIDNSRILKIDLENFDMKMKIVSVDEDDENYYLEYQYQTIGIKDNIWQELIKLEKMDVSKKSIEGQDLGIYAIEELGEVIDSELAYLKKVQLKEKKSGEKTIEEKTEYEGLLGLVINTKTKELPASYELVVKPPVIEYAPSEPEPPIPSTPSVYISPEIMPLQCNSSHLDLCDTKELCEAKGLHWYEDEGECKDSGPTLDSVYCQNQKALCGEEVLFWCGQDCNEEEEEVIVEDPVCDSDNLDLCEESDCETAGGFWYGEVCNDSCKEISFYLDEDGDGFGYLDNSISTCELPDGYVENSDDCDDGNIEINPDATEICGNEIDENCDGEDNVCEEEEEEE